MMNQKEHTSKLSIKKLAISVSIQFLAFILSAALFSYFLLKIPKYENYMSFAVIGIMILISLVNALISKPKGKLAILYAGIGSLLFSLICVSIGLLTAKSEAFSLWVVLRFAGHIAFSLIFTLFFMRFSKKKKGQKFRFSK